MRQGWKWFAFWALVIWITSSTWIDRDAFVGVIGSHLSRTASAQWSSGWKQLWFVPVKGYHMLEFALLFLFGTRIWTARTACCVAVGYAALDEFHQHFVQFRGGRLSDVLIDAAGILIAYVIFVHRGRSAGATSRPVVCTAQHT